MPRKEAQMPKAEWPSAEKRSLIGKRIDRADGPAKAAGTAKYSYDINRPNMLWAKVVTSPFAHAEVAGVDTSAAEKLEGVKGVWKDDGIPGKEVQYVGQIVAAVAATTEEIAREAASLVKVEYKALEHQVVDSNPEFSKGNPGKKEMGNVDEAFGNAGAVHTWNYGIPVIAHCCLEPHG